MPDLVTALVQAGVILATGVLLHRRLLVVLVAAIVAVGEFYLAYPDSLARPPVEHAIGSAGVVVGLLLGWIAVHLREERRAPALRQRDMLSDPLLHYGSSTGRRIAWTLVALLVAGAGAAAWLFHGGRSIEQVREEAIQWVAPLTSGVAAGGAARTTPASASAPAAATRTPPAPTRTSTNETVRSRAAASPDKPRGDLRHCLEQGGNDSVARCAESGR
jgi:hypothetical protein